MDKKTSNADANDRIRLNKEFEQNYRPVKRSNVQSHFDNGNQSEITARRIEGYDDVYVSDKAYIKPKALNSINSRTEDAMKEYGITGAKPKIVIADSSEINCYGKYNAISNCVYYAPEINNPDIIYDTGNVEYHEMWHMKQAERYISNGNTITESNYADYVRSACKTSKKY